MHPTPVVAARFGLRARRRRTHRRLHRLGAADEQRADQKQSPKPQLLHPSPQCSRGPAANPIVIALAFP